MPALTTIKIPSYYIKGETDKPRYLGLHWESGEIFKLKPGWMRRNLENNHFKKDIVEYSDNKHQAAIEFGLKELRKKLGYMSSNEQGDAVLDMIKKKQFLNHPDILVVIKETRELKNPAFPVRTFIMMPETLIRNMTGDHCTYTTKKPRRNEKKYIAFVRTNEIDLADPIFIREVPNLICGD
jgi:hypothetical protein